MCIRDSGKGKLILRHLPGAGTQGPAAAVGGQQCAVGAVYPVSYTHLDVYKRQELHVRLGVDGRHADQQVRGAVVLPNGTGKTVRVYVRIRKLDLF